MKREDIIFTVKKLMNEGGYPKICKLAETKNNDREVYNSFAVNLAQGIWTLKTLAIELGENQYKGIRDNEAQYEDNKDGEYEIYRIFLPQIYLLCEEIKAVLADVFLEEGEINAQTSSNGYRKIKKKINKRIDEEYPFIFRIEELGVMISRFIEMFDENPSWFEKLREFAIYYERE